MANGRMLVLDDDAAVGQILLAGAQVSGLEAVLCATLAELRAALAAGPAPTHVAIDLTLPDATTDDVLQALAASGCRAQVIVCSGAGAEALEAALEAARGLGLPVAGALAKPFRLAALRDLLAAPG